MHSLSSSFHSLPSLFASSHSFFLDCLSSFLPGPPFLTTSSAFLPLMPKKKEREAAATGALLGPPAAPSASSPAAPRSSEGARPAASAAASAGLSSPPPSESPSPRLPDRRVLPRDLLLGRREERRDVARERRAVRRERVALGENVFFCSGSFRFHSGGVSFFFRVQEKSLLFPNPHSLSLYLIAKPSHGGLELADARLLL